MELTAPEGKIREANMRLPEHQREALALRELDGLSYDEIATIMGTSRSAVAQLISRARINLHDELRGNVLASIAAPSPECERALPLIAMRDDGQLDAADGDATWLDAHLSGCGRCRLGVEVMREARASYRALAPIAATSRLFDETMAKAAELDGRGRSRRNAILAAGLGALLIFAGVAAAVFAGEDPPTVPAEPAAGSARTPATASSKAGAKHAKPGDEKRTASKKKARPTGSEARAEQTAPAAATAGETTPPTVPTTTQATAGSGAPSEPPSNPSRSVGKTAVQPTQPTSTSKPSAKPKPAPAPAPAPEPAPAPQPVAEEPLPDEESPGKSSGRADPPGKPADRPPK